MFLNRKDRNVYLFDIDGTLMKDGVIPDSAKEVIKEIREEGDLVMLSTGRCKSMLQDVLSQIEVDGAIQNNGAYVYIGKEVLFESQISPEVIHQIDDDGLNLSVLSKDRYVRFQNTNKAFKKFAEGMKIIEPKKGDRAMIDNDKIYSLSIVDMNLDSIDIKKYPSLRFIRVSDLGYDIVNKGVSKSSCYDIIRKKYPGGRIIAFGDNVNDIEMLDEADIAICMPTAPESVRKVSSFVTRDVLADGIEFAVYNFVKRVLD